MDTTPKAVKKIAIDVHCPVRVLGNGRPHHFFGYYNKTTWDSTGQLLLSNRVPMMSADLTGQEVAAVGYFDLRDNDRFHQIGTTTTWNWLMGCQLQWLENSVAKEIIYNVRADSPKDGGGDFQSRIYNLDTRKERSLSLPIYVVAPNAMFALCVNYSRLQITHKTIGYVATDVEPPLESAPADDGICYMDLITGETKQIVSLQQLRDFDPRPSMDKALHWVTHLEIAPGSARFLFIHRWTERVEDETCFLHRLFSANPDGSELRLLECTDHPLPQLSESFDRHAVGVFDYEKSEYQISHPAWKNDESIIVWSPHDGEIHYHLYNDKDGSVDVIGDQVLVENGHMTYSSDGQWLLSDTYPDAESNKQVLLLYHVETNTLYNIGEFYTPPELGKHSRCDLHPRWSPDNKQISIDSAHDGARQQYIVDVEAIVNRHSSA